MSELTSSSSHPYIISSSPVEQFGGDHLQTALSESVVVQAITSPSSLPSHVESTVSPVVISDEVELFRRVLVEILKVDKIQEAIAEKKTYVISALSRRLNKVNEKLDLDIFPNTPLRIRLMEGLIQHLGTLDVKVIPATIGGNISAEHRVLQLPKEPEAFPTLEIIEACQKVVFEELLKRPSRYYPLSSLTNRVRSWVRKGRHPQSMSIHIVSSLKATLEADHKFDIYPPGGRPLGADDDVVGKKSSVITPESFIPEDEDGEFLDSDLDDGSDDLDCGEYEDVNFEAIGIHPNEPTKAKPGSEEKILMIAARYAAGMPLWHADDCTDHGPRGARIDDD